MVNGISSESSEETIIMRVLPFSEGTLLSEANGLSKSDSMIKRIRVGLAGSVCVDRGSALKLN